MAKGKLKPSKDFVKTLSKSIRLKKGIDGDVDVVIDGPQSPTRPKLGGLIGFWNEAK
jgi:hypothetical protein